MVSPCASRGAPFPAGRVKIVGKTLRAIAYDATTNSLYSAAESLEGDQWVVRMDPAED